MSHPTPPHARRLLPQHCSRRRPTHPNSSGAGNSHGVSPFWMFFLFCFSLQVFSQTTSFELFVLLAGCWWCGCRRTTPWLLLSTHASAAR